MTLVQTELKKITMRTTSRLPAEYQEVEYIESTGTQWIDTGLNAGIGYRINMKIYTTSSSNLDQTVIGGNDNTNTEAVYCGLNYADSYKSIYRGYNNQWFDANNIIAVGNTYEIESIIRNGTQKLTVNGTVKFTGSLSLSGTGTNHMAIFSRRGTNYALIKLYSMQIYNSSDALVRNFVPCYRKQDTVIGLYDLVNNQFYINSGTGTFTKGANIGGEKKIKKIVVFPDGVTEKQIRLAGWTPCTITGSTTIGVFTPSQGSDIQGCYISPDGTKMYIDFWGNKTLYQYALSTPRDVTTATSVRYISVNTPDGIYFDDTGTYMFIGCENDHSIKRYTLSTPRDISTATQDQSLSLGTYYAYMISLSEDGKHIYYGRYTGSQDLLYSYDLSTAYNLTTATNQKSVYINTGKMISVKNNGKYMFVAHENGNPIIQYELATPYDITSNKTEIGRFTLSSYNDGRALFVSNDCKYWTFAIGSSGQYIRQYQTVQI